MSRFQYEIVSLGVFNVADKMVNAFSHLGSNGWELVGIFDKSSNWLGSGFEKGFAVFKREISDNETPDGPWAKFVHAEHVGNPDDPRNDPNWGAW
jgi:hypothetical protein